MVWQVESAMWLLMRLDPKCDPVWDYLCDKEQRIRGMLQGCVAEHEGKLAAVRRRPTLEARAEALHWGQLQEETRQILHKVPHPALGPITASWRHCIGRCQ